METLSDSEFLRPLSLDLDLNRVVVIVARASAGKKLSSSDRECVAVLSSKLKHEVESLRQSSDIPEATVPDSSMRKMLQETLASFSQIPIRFVQENQDLLDEIVQTLKGLNNSSLSKAELSQLLAGLLRLDAGSYKPISIPRLDIKGKNAPDRTGI